MQVERGRFLLFVSTLAAGGAGGYLLAQARKPVISTMREPAPAPTATPTALPVGHAELTSAKIKSSCDDSVGEPGECPPIGLPTTEGGCGSLANTRCKDFKKTMKPRVAAAAVACLVTLKAGEQCDPKRIELCAHNALRKACDDSSAPSVVQACDSLAATCAGISRRECTMTMSGLRETGREALVDCAKAHCNDKGIMGCAAAAGL
jgi:hypothetical protein